MIACIKSKANFRKNKSSTIDELFNTEVMKLKLAKQREIKLLIKNLFIYAIFIWTLFVVCFSVHNEASFYYQKSLAKHIGISEVDNSFVNVYYLSYLMLNLFYFNLTRHILLGKIGK